MKKQIEAKIKVLEQKIAKQQEDIRFLKRLLNMIKKENNDAIRKNK